MTTMKASERRRGYGLKRIVISQHNYLALKALGQAGDSFNDVITNLLLIQRNYQQQEKEKEDNKSREKQKQEQEKQPLQRQQQWISNDDNNSISNIISRLYSPSHIGEIMERDSQRLAEITQMYEEEEEEQKKNKKKQEKNSDNNKRL